MEQCGVLGKGEKSAEAERGFAAWGGAQDPEAGWAGSRATDLGIDVHLSRAEQQAHHLQVPDLGCVVEASGAVLLLREMWAGESSS